MPKGQRTDTTNTKRKGTKDRYYKCQRDKGQILQIPKGKGQRTDTTNVKRKGTKDRYYKCQRDKGRTHHTENEGLSTTNLTQNQGMNSCVPEV